MYKGLDYQRFAKKQWIFQVEEARIEIQPRHLTNLQLYPIQHPGHWLGYLSKGYLGILLMEEILHYLGCINPSKSWDKLPTAGAGFQPSTVWIPGHAFIFFCWGGGTLFWTTIVHATFSWGVRDQRRKIAYPPGNERISPENGWLEDEILFKMVPFQDTFINVWGDLKVFWANL